MKKIWIIQVEQAAEGTDCWYGPFTKETAIQLGQKLGSLLKEMGSHVYTIPLQYLSVKEVLAQYRKEFLEG